MKDLIFLHEYFLYLLLLIPLLSAWYIFRQLKRQPTVRLSSFSFITGKKLPLRLIVKHFLFSVRMMALALLIIALARPQSTSSWSESTTEGIDITLCMDISGSMMARDFTPDRLEAAKDVAAEFVNSRPTDRFAVVVFSGESFTLSPLTSDKSVVINQLNSIAFGMIEDGTAVGMGLATSVNRLKDSKAKSKVIILLTDGVNNRGTISPETAAEIAEEFGIRVYTIGVGTRGTAPMPVQGMFGTQLVQVPVEIDENMLTSIANSTGGKYFRATDNNKLRDIYTEIDSLEKTLLDTRNYSSRKEEYFLFLLWGIILLFSETLVRYTIVRTIP